MLGKRPLPQTSPRRQRSGAAAIGSQSPRRSRSGAFETVALDSLDATMLRELERLCGHGENVQIPDMDVAPAASSFATAHELIENARNFLRLSLLSECCDNLRISANAANRPKHRMEIVHPLFTTREAGDFLRAEVSSPTLRKYPKSTSAFHNRILLLSAQTQNGWFFCGMASCDNASQSVQLMHMLRGTFDRLQAILPAAIPPGTIVAVPVVSMQWATAEHEALQAFANLPQEMLTRRDRALHYYMLPAENPVPSDIAINDWQRSPPLSLVGFNPEQREALACSATIPHGLVLVQGPPGTGKSHVIANGLVPLALEGRVVVACVSNKAVDSLVLKLVAAAAHRHCSLCHHDIVRVGFASSVSPQVHSAGVFVDKDREIEILPSKRVVCTTLYHLAKVCSRPDAWGTAGYVFRTLIVDEAGAVTEAMVRQALAACSGHVEKLVLVGDHHQLQPIVKSELLSNQGYGRSPLERAVDQGARVVMLKEQWRMTADIRSLVSRLAYNNQLRDSASIQARCVKPLGPPLFGKSIIIVDLGFGIAERDESGSRKNRAEAEAVREVIDVLCAVGCDSLGMPPASAEGGGVGAADAGRELRDRTAVVTPFRAHTQTVAAVLQGVSEQDAKGYALDYDDVGSAPQDGTPLVGTAHAFQGSERDCVVLSPCHNSAFANDWRILNVGLSRAKFLLVVVGRVSQFANESALWRTIFDHGARCGLVVRADSPADVRPSLQAELNLNRASA